VRKPGSEIWATFNPDQEADYVYQRFVVNTDPDAWVCEINWRDNPWFGPEMDTERRKLKALNDDLYAHVWEGKPRSAAGLLFKRHWFKRFDLGDEPKVLNCYMASDYAVTDADDPDVDREPDWTEHGVFGIDQHADLWALDWWSGQTDPHVWIQAWLTLGRRNKILTAFEEAGVILRSQNAAINRAMKVANTYLHRESLPSAGKKAERALGFAARAAAGAVWIPNTEWGDRLINQLCAFNGQDGRTDDMVDVCSLLARGLDEMADPAPAAESGKPKPAAMTLDWLDRHDKQDAADAAQRARYYR
jgi:phage terminase large subunit-like protein